MNKENKYKLKPFLLSLFMKNKIISLSIKNNRNLVKTYRKQGNLDDGREITAI